MSNVALMVNATPPAIPQSLLEQYNAMALQMGDGFQGTLNFIRPGKMNFKLVEGGSAREVNNGEVVAVLLGVAPHDHCTWYEKQYVQGQEPEEPDLVWEWPNQSVFPPALPEQFRRKQLINGKERWAFRVARRTVWALVARDANGVPSLNLQSPYILDITSMSMFGKSEPDANTYKFSGLMSLCQRLSQPPAFICSPSMFMTQILIDPAAPVSGVVVFRPAFQNGSPQYLDSDTFQNVLELMMSQAVKDMLKVREKLERGPRAAAPAQPASQPVSQTVSQPTQAQPTNQPAQERPVSQPVSQPAQQVVPSEDLLAQAQAVLDGAAPAQPVSQPARPQGAGIPVAQGVNPVTANAINALDGILGF